MGITVRPEVRGVTVVRVLGVLIVTVSMLASWLGIGSGPMHVFGAVLGLIAEAKSGVVAGLVGRWVSSIASAVRSWWSRRRVSTRPAMRPSMSRPVRAGAVAWIGASILLSSIASGYYRDVRPIVVVFWAIILVATTYGLVVERWSVVRVAGAGLIVVSLIGIFLPALLHNPWYYPPIPGIRTLQMLVALLGVMVLAASSQTIRRWYASHRLTAALAVITVVVAMVAISGLPPPVACHDCHDPFRPFDPCDEPKNDRYWNGHSPEIGCSF